MKIRDFMFERIEDVQKFIGHPLELTIKSIKTKEKTPNTAVIEFEEINQTLEIGPTIGEQK